LTRHLTEDDCLDLLHGLLSADRRATALEHVSTCAACEQMFADHAAYDERLRARGELQLQPDGTVALGPRITADSSAYESESPSRSRVIPIRRYFQVGAVAAAAAAVILMLVLPGSQQSPTIKSLRPVPGVGEQIHLRSEPGSVWDKNFERGIETYTRGDLRDAVDLLQKSEVTGQRDNLRRIYLGNALARLGDFEGAVKILEPVPFHAVPDPWAGEGRWTLYVAYAATGQASEAEALLNELSREPGEFGDRAREASGSK
jgi:tetratricopeptide (TPR) repeat protein